MPLPSQKNNTSFERNWTVLHSCEREFLNGKSIVISEERFFDPNLFSHQFPQAEWCIDSIQSVCNLYNGYCVQAPAMF